MNIVDISNFLRHSIELLILITIVIEVILLSVKVLKNEKGSRSLLLLLLVSTVFARDILLTLEVHVDKDVNTDVLIIEVVTIFITFAVISFKDKYLTNESKETTIKED